MQTKDISKLGCEDVLKINSDGADWSDIKSALDAYFATFCSPGVCPKCGSKLGGFLGSFRWGLAYGEGVCTGGHTGIECGWPCRAYHFPKDADGKEIFDGAITCLLPYHPDFVEGNSDE
jgi:hypothetical protein